MTQYQIGINPNFKNREIISGNNSQYSYYSTTPVTFEGIKKIVKKGWSFTAMTFKKGIRGKNNFIKSSLVFLDYDKDFTIPGLFAVPFVDSFGFGYTTGSHTPEKHRMRLGFKLPCAIYDVELYEAIVRVLQQKTECPFDENAKDGARLWYGNTEAQFINWSEDVPPVPMEIITEAQELLERRIKEKEEKQRLFEQKRKEREESNKELDITTNEVETAIDNILRKLATYQKGNNTYQTYLNIGTAIKNELGFDSAVYKMDGIAPALNWGVLLRSTTSEIRLEGLINQAKLLGYKWDSEDFPWAERQKQQRVLNDPQYGQVMLSGDTAQDLATVNNKINTVEELLDRVAKNSTHKPIKAIEQRRKLAEQYKVFYVEDRYSDYPTYKKFEGADIQPKIVFSNNIAPEEKVLYIQKLINLGAWKHLHDRSIVGSGKSHMVAKFDDVMYLDKDYKNPSVDAIKDNFVELVARVGQGKYRNKLDGKVKIDPNLEELDMKIWEKIGDVNCIRADWFTALAKKNINVSEGEGVSPCKGCKWAEKDDSGRSYCEKSGYIGQKAESVYQASIKRKARAYNAQITKKYQKTFNEFTAIWEEAGVSSDITETKIPLTTIRSLNFVVAENENLDPDLKVALTKILTRLEKITLFGDSVTSKFFEDVREQNAAKGFGVLDPHIRKYLYEDLTISPEALSFELFGLYSDNNCLANQLVSEYYKQTGGVNWNKKKTAIENINEIEDQQLLPLLRAICGKKAIFMSYGNKIKVFHKNIMRETLANKVFKANIYLDATATKEKIAGIYGLFPCNLLLLETYTPPLKNLNIVEINVKGFGSNDLSDKALDRGVLLIDWLKKYHEGKKVNVLTYKAKVKALSTSYYFGNHDRGTNIFKDSDVLILAGMSRRNMNAIKIEYIINQVDCYSFEEYYQNVVNEDCIQAIGRLRAQHRPNDPLVVYILNSRSIDLSFIQETFSCKLHYLDGWQLCTELLSTEQKYVYVNSDLAVNFREKDKISQKVIADALGVTQGFISKIQQGFFGLMGSVKKILLTLSNITKKNNKSNLSEKLKTDTLQLQDKFKAAAYALRRGYEYTKNLLLSIGANPLHLLDNLLSGFITFTDTDPELIIIHTPQISLFTLSKILKVFCGVNNPISPKTPQKIPLRT